MGIGPGDIEQMSLKAYRLLQDVDVIAGYTTYIDLIKPLISSSQQVIETGMGREKERAETAINLARQGYETAVVSSGDPGIYGMAGLVLEMLSSKNIRIETEVIPGITAEAAAASRLGAPLMHDQAIISLSDLLTPWEKIEDRLNKAAAGDFITALYNPSSKKRTEHIKQAQKIFLEHRKDTTPVGIVRSVSRDSEQITLTDLANMLDQQIDMLTTVIIGNSETFIEENIFYTENGAMITPRGYDL